MISSRNTALISGIGGQDGWYLARRLLDLGYAVTGSTHRPDATGTLPIAERNVPVLFLDLTNTGQIEDFMRAHQFDEMYNLAARSSSDQLFDDPLATADVNGVGVARLLEAIKKHSPETRFCQASSNEVFRGLPSSCVNESSPRLARNAYGAAKAFADHLIGAYRATYGLFACSAVLFSHESPRRPPHYLVRRVTNAAARIAGGRVDSITLGSLTSTRDWGYAPDYVEAMRLMLQADQPADYVIATGESHSVSDVCEVAFSHVGLDWRNHVASSDPGDATQEAGLIGNASQARAELFWATTKTFSELVTAMVDFDVSLLAERDHAEVGSHVPRD